MTPSREAVRRWAQAYADTCREEDGDRVQRIITLADDAVVAGLHGARESEHPEKYLLPSNAVAGTYRDKRDRTGKGGDTFIFQLMQQARDHRDKLDSIEGEYRELPEPSTGAQTQTTKFPPPH